MKQTLLSILLVLFSLIGCQTLDAVDTITVGPTEITVGPTTEATQATVSDTEPTENDPIVESMPQETLPPETQPAPTQAVTEPAETEPAPIETKPTETQPPETAPVETEPIPTEPPETEATEPVTTEPTGCQHDWTCIHHTEEGHWVAGVACSCGWTAYGDPAQLVSLWNAHSASFTPVESLLEHGGYGSIDSWVVDKPAYDEWVCSRCGDPKP